jgi:DeoR family transcriptional regulator, deoxyribose operon repressor
MNKQTERLNKIIETLKINTGSTIHELADSLSVSHMTVRRDLQVLEREEMVKPLFGGVVLGPRAATDAESRYYLLEAGKSHPEEKTRIGIKAASLIESGDIVIIDSGSTTVYAARYLQETTPLTIICYALNILLESVKKESSRLFFAGGLFHENTLMFESNEGLDLIRESRATKALISAAGIDERLGVTCAEPYERETKKAALNSSQKRILLVDSSKFGAVQHSHFAELDDFDEIVTDDKIPETYKLMIEEREIPLHIV